MAFGFVEVPAPRLGPRRVLVAACERRVVDAAVRALEGLRQRPQSLTVACHELPALLTRPVRARRAVWAHRHGATTSLLFLGRGQIRLSRSVQLRDAGELLAEVTATLPLLKWRDVEALWVSGDDTDSMLASEALAGAQYPVSEPPVLPLAESFMRELGAEERGGGLLALGLALGSRRPALDLLPVGLRPTSLSVGQLVTVAMLAVTTVLGLGLLVAQDYRSERYLEDVSGAIKALDPEVKTVERMAGELAQKRRVLAALEGAEQRTLRPLTFLRDLTDALPPDVWLSALTMDTKGVEITGQAGAASQLIPLLEGSAWLERAEFISPVTKTRDKEQFRIRAAWEPDAGRRAGEQRLPQPGSPPSAPRPAGAPARPVTTGPGG
jgi:Tfp pilus assembly protein PilN